MRSVSIVLICVILLQLSNIYVAEVDSSKDDQDKLSLCEVKEKMYADYNKHLIEANKFLREQIELLTYSIEELANKLSTKENCQINEAATMVNSIQMESTSCNSKEQAELRTERTITEQRMNNYNKTNAELEITQLIAKEEALPNLKKDLIAAELTELNNQTTITEQLMNNQNRQIRGLTTNAAGYDEAIDLGKSLKQEIQTLSNTTEKLSLEIEQLKQKVNTDAMAKVIENELESKNKKIKQLEEQVLELRNRIVDKVNKMHKLEMEVKGYVGNEMKYRNSCVSYGYSSEVHTLYLSKGYTHLVLCNSDIAGPGWTVIQQRITDGLIFNRNGCQNGFVYSNKEFFLGLEAIHRLTSEQPHELYIHMQKFDGSIMYARYDEFAISGEGDQYQLSKLGEFNGSIDTVDSLRYFLNMQFSINDLSSENCAELFENVWLNGNCLSCKNEIHSGFQVINGQSSPWSSELALKQITMMIRPVQFSNL